MTRELDAVRDGAVVTAVPLSLKQRRMIAADAFINRGNEFFKTLDQIEYMENRENEPVTGNILELVVTALNDAGFATAENVGGVMESLHVDFDTLHAEICNCKHGGEITGARARINFLNIANLAA